MADIFLSYAREDRERITPIQSGLEALGLSVFVDIDGGVQAGDSFPQVIADRVIAAKAVVACWTPHALTRPWCRRECLLALEGQKLVPLAIASLTAQDLKEFIDVSYEDLTDFTGQPQHFGWSQSLRALARAIDVWAECHPDGAADAFALAARLKHAAMLARPDAAVASEQVAPRAELWSRLKGSMDVSRLGRFAESFPGTTEAFEARELIAAINDYQALRERFDGKPFAGLPVPDFYTSLRADAEAAETAIAELDLLFALPNPYETTGPGGDDLDYLDRQYEFNRPFYDQRNAIHKYQHRWHTYRDALATYLDRWRVHPETPEISARIAAVDDVERRLGDSMTRVLALMTGRDAAVSKAYEDHRQREKESNDRALEDLHRYQEERDREDAEDTERETQRKEREHVHYQREEQRNAAVGAAATVSTLILTTCMAASANSADTLLGGLIIFGLGSLIVGNILFGMTRAVLGDNNVWVFWGLCLLGSGWLGWSFLQG